MGFIKIDGRTTPMSSIGSELLKEFKKNEAKERYSLYWRNALGNLILSGFLIMSSILIIQTLMAGV